LRRGGPRHPENLVIITLLRHLAPRGNERAHGSRNGNVSLVAWLSTRRTASLIRPPWPQGPAGGCRLMLAALLLASEIHLAVVGGAGLAQDFLGAHLEVRAGHAALFAGTGLSSISGAFNASGLATYGGVFGGRWFSGANGDRLFISGQF